MVVSEDPVSWDRKTEEEPTKWEEDYFRQREQRVWKWRALGAPGGLVRSGRDDVYGWCGQQPGHWRPQAKLINWDFIWSLGGKLR